MTETGIYNDKDNGDHVSREEKIYHVKLIM